MKGVKIVLDIGPMLLTKGERRRPPPPQTQIFATLGGRIALKPEHYKRGFICITLPEIKTIEEI
jgi:hypothetical protein